MPATMHHSCGTAASDCAFTLVYIFLWTRCSNASSPLVAGLCCGQIAYNHAAQRWQCSKRGVAQSDLQLSSAMSRTVSLACVWQTTVVVQMPATTHTTYRSAATQCGSYYEVCRLPMRCSHSLFPTSGKLRSVFTPACNIVKDRSLLEHTLVAACCISRWLGRHNSSEH